MSQNVTFSEGLCGSFGIASFFFFFNLFAYQSVGVSVVCSREEVTLAMGFGLPYVLLSPG